MLRDSLKAAMSQLSLPHWTKNKQIYLLTPMDRATLFNAKSTISHCTPLAAKGAIVNSENSEVSGPNAT